MDASDVCNSCSCTSAIVVGFVMSRSSTEGRKDGNNGELDVYPDLLRKDTVRYDLSKWRISSHALENHAKGS